MIHEDVKKEFVYLIKTMDIPDVRREASSPNLLWFIRNAWIRNGNHDNFEKAMILAKQYS